MVDFGDVRALAGPERRLYRSRVGMNFLPPFFPRSALGGPAIASSCQSHLSVAGKRIPARSLHRRLPKCNFQDTLLGSKDGATKANQP